MQSRMAWMTMTYLIMMLLNGNTDDDDPAYKQLLAYITTRMYQEASAFASPQEALGVILKPVPGASFWDDVTSIIGGDRPNKKTYANNLEALLSLTIPGYKGIAETSPVPLPAPDFIDKKDNTIGNPRVALKGKNKYIKNIIIGPNLLSPASWFWTPEGDTQDWIENNWMLNAIDDLTE
jgi:hypothetical protein